MKPLNITNFLETCFACFQGQANPSFPTGPHAPGGYDPNLSQVNPPLGQRMPQVVAPSPNVRGFAPVTNPGVQRPNVSAMQPPSPTQAAPVQPPASPAVPPPTVQTVDTSNVPGNFHFLFFPFACFIHRLLLNPSYEQKTYLRINEVVCVLIVFRHLV